jgi:hypothetical protein
LPKRTNYTTSHPPASTSSTHNGKPRASRALGWFAAEGVGGPTGAVKGLAKPGEANPGATKRPLWAHCASRPTTSAAGASTAGTRTRADVVTTTDDHAVHTAAQSAPTATIDAESVPPATTGERGPLPAAETTKRRKSEAAHRTGSNSRLPY